MTLHLLIVEDDDTVVEELQEAVKSLPGDAEIRVAGSRNQAYEMLESGFLDLVILDLKIPTVTGALDADPQHGHAVFYKSREIAPGTPIFVLTGSSADDFIPELLRNQKQIDIWGEGSETGTILFRTKYDIDKCPEILEPIAQAVENLSEVELETGGLNLTLAEDRLVRIFARQFQGVRCTISELRGGLSRARVMRLRVTDEHGATIHNAVAKLATPADVRHEGRCYDSHIIRLAPAATPRKLAILEYGACNLAGIFFGLATGSDESVFDVVNKSPQRAQAVVRGVEAAMKRWAAGVPEMRRTIREVRRRLLCDQSLDQLLPAFSLDWVRRFEGRRIQMRWVCTHGDLHGKNILVSDTSPELIDYDDVRDGPASLDPVTLELSLLFHPDAPGKTGSWPTIEQAKAWGNLEVYVKDCPFREFVRECRAWALRAAAGNREVAASAYSYLVRQLKYNDTNTDRALALLDGVRAFYDGTT